MVRRKNPTGSIAKFDPGDEPWRCCAESKQHKGQRCKNKAVPGRRTCHRHGGTTPGRPPVNGRHTGVFKRLREVYNASLNDPSLLDIRESLALLDVIVHRCVERAEKLDTPEFRDQARNLFNEAKRLGREGKAEEAAEAIEHLGSLLRRGCSEDSAMMSLLKSVKAQADTTIDVWNVRLKKAQVINERDLSVILMRMHDVVIDTAPPDMAAKILDRMERVIHVPAGASLGQTGEGYYDMPAPSGQVRYVEVDDGAEEDNDPGDPAEG